MGVDSFGHGRRAWRICCFRICAIGRTSRKRMAQAGSVIHEYKRLICFDPNVFANDHELRSGILRTGEGPGRTNKATAEHCRLMLKTPRCFVYVAPAIVRNFVGLYGADRASMSVDTWNRDTGLERFWASWTSMIRQMWRSSSSFGRSSTRPRGA